MSETLLHSIIPAPVKCRATPGRFSLLPTTRIIAAGKFEVAARQYRNVLQSVTGWQFEVEPLGGSHPESAIWLEEDADLPGQESYRLVIVPWAVWVKAGGPTGAFYALQTLMQLLPPAVHQGVPRRDVEWSLPCAEIEDGPRFPWRGVLLDSSRHFQPVEFIKKFLDLMALQKLNIFHWHLVDDQGWRLEIKKYPRLCEVGAWRRETCVGNSMTQGDGARHGGFYTQEEVREIVAYAAERHITIMPEIEMPGHSQAAQAAYPEFASTREALEVSTHWGIHKHLFNAEEKTFRFLEEVLEETMGLFPGPYIHLGGDEAVKEEWKENAQVQARMRELGLKDENALQGYFISRMAKFLATHGRRAVCWDEIFEEGGLPSDAVLMSWRGMDAGVRAAATGHDVIMTPTQGVYLDYYQSTDTSSEPLTWGPYLPLERCYTFDPVAQGMPAEDACRIRGLQGNIWTEFMPTPGHVEYMAFPRLTALSEVAWSVAGNRDYEDFRRRLKVFLRRLDMLGVRYRNPER